MTATADTDVELIEQLLSTTATVAEARHLAGLTDRPQITHVSYLGAGRPTRLDAPRPPVALSVPDAGQDRAPIRA